ncbi:hypothetical protein CsatB_004189 [Cannabis sativa]
MLHLYLKNILMLLAYCKKKQNINTSYKITIIVCSFISLFLKYSLIIFFCWSYISVWKIFYFSLFRETQPIVDR